MFVTQATIERRAAKEARMHAIEERLESLTSAVAVTTSRLDETAATGLVSAEETDTAADVRCLREEMTAMAGRMDSNQEEVAAQLSKRDEVLAQLEKHHEDHIAATTARFDAMEAELHAVKATLEEIRRESAEVMKSLEKKIAAASKPLFTTKSGTSSSN